MSDNSSSGRLLSGDSVSKAARRLTALACLLAALSAGASGDLGWLVAGGLSLLLAVTVGLGGRPTLSRFGQLALHLGVMGAGVMGATALGESQAGRFGLLVTALAGTQAALRFLFRNGRLGQAITLGFALVGLMGQARAAERPVFGALVFGLVGLSVAALVASDPGLSAAKAGRRGVWARLAAGLGTAGLLVGGGLGLPLLEPYVTAYLEPFLMGGEGRAGFGDGRVALGHLTKIQESTEVVARVFGDTDHLRGAVYVDYRGGHWTVKPRRGQPDQSATHGRLVLGQGEGLTVRVEAEPESGRALFAPLDATALTGPAETTLDAFGVVSIPPELTTERRTYELTVSRAASRALAAPNEDDLRLPEALKGRLDPVLATLSGVKANAPSERLAALERFFSRGFTYSLTLSPTPPGQDPVVDFLTRTKSGHCEFYASALVLLARRVGLPARLVTGYRVLEPNEDGGYFVVRAQDAHAWAEVYLEGRWRTVDVTPASELPGSHRHAGWLEALGDRVGRRFALVMEALAELTFEEVVTVALSVAALGGLWLWWRRWTRRQLAIQAPVEAVEAALAGLAELRLGEPRAPHETLLRYAERLDKAALPELAAAYRSLSALRYGRLGDPAALAQTVSGLLAQA